jgi:hypothetical protein
MMLCSSPADNPSRQRRASRPMLCSVKDDALRSALTLCSVKADALLSLGWWGRRACSLLAGLRAEPHLNRQAPLAGMDPPLAGMERSSIPELAGLRSIPASSAWTVQVRAVDYRPRAGQVLGSMKTWGFLHKNLGISQISQACGPSPIQIDRLPERARNRTMSVNSYLWRDMISSLLR